MPELSEHDAALLRSAQVALEELAKIFAQQADDKGRSRGLSQYAEGWVDALNWACREAETRAKALGSLRG